MTRLLKADSSDPRIVEWVKEAHKKIKARWDAEQFLQNAEGEWMFVEADGEIVGVISVALKFCPYSQTPYLLVEFMYAKPKTVNGAVLAEQLRTLAALAQAEYIEFQSPRFGWAVLAAEHGFMPETIIYRMEVQ